MSAEDVIGDICGFFIVIVAVILLNAFQNMDISLNDIRTIMRPRRVMLNGIGDGTYTLDNVQVRQNSKEIKNSYGTNGDLLRQL